MNEQYMYYAGGGVTALQKWYDPAKGLWESAGWWHAANALWLLADYASRTRLHLIHQIEYHNAIENTFERNKGKNFLNSYYDDEGWWGLAWVKAYDLGHDARYLAMAQTIFADMTQGWDTHCGGGLWWSKDRTYKNAIPNELFLTLAARLAQRVEDNHQATAYLDWANRSWNWFASSGLINPHNLINDGLNSNCQNNNGPTWTYNQGVILGGLVEMHTLTHNNAYIQHAEAIADAVLREMVDSKGILHDPCEAAGNCGADTPQFKGVFVRNLAHLYSVDKQDSYKQFLLKNADSIVQNNRNEAFQFGLKWDGPLDAVDAARQTAALDAIVAATFLDEL